jgi:hypothetical protein
MNQQDSAVGTYEIRVHGLLGPLLLSSLPHTAAARVERHSLIILDSPDGSDLVDVLRLIVGSGLEVDSIRAVAHEDAADAAD